MKDARKAKCRMQFFSPFPPPKKRKNQTSGRGEQFNLSQLNLNISAPLTRKGSHAENKASHGRKLAFSYKTMLRAYI